MALLRTICVCGLVSLALSVSPECEGLIKPLVLTDPSVLHGKWIVVAAVGEGSMAKYLEDMSSSWIDLTPMGEEGKLSLRWGDTVNGQCLPGSTEVAVSGSNASMMFEGVLHEGEYLQSCPDCFLFLDTSKKDGISSKYLFLSKREGSLTEAEVETLKKQAECLDLSPKIFTYQPSGLCPY